MKMWSVKSAILLTCLLLTINAAFAYKVTTHEMFSVYAVDSSILRNNPTLLSDFGLGPYGTEEFTNSDNLLMNIRDIVAFGANFEDDGGSPFQLISPFRTKRFFRHFFDPQSGSGLTFLTESFPPSPDWVLEINSGGAVLDLQNPEQAYSYKNDYAEYAVKQTVNGQARLHIIGFSRDSNGQWMIEQL